MAELDVTVAGRRRRLACEDGEEPHLQRLAAMLDEEARRLAPRMGPVGDAQMLLMTGLMLADRLHEAMEMLKQAERALSVAQGGAQSGSQGGATSAARSSPTTGAAQADDAGAQPGLFAEDEAAATLQGAIDSLEAALARRGDDPASR